jgi:hypothetical protein
VIGAVSTTVSKASQAPLRCPGREHVLGLRFFNGVVNRGYFVETVSVERKLPWQSLAPGRVISERDVGLDAE